MSQPFGLGSVGSSSAGPWLSPAPGHSHSCIQLAHNLELGSLRGLLGRVFSSPWSLILHRLVQASSYNSRRVSRQQEKANPQYISPFQAFAYITFTNIPLAKASHQAKPRIIVKGLHKDVDREWFIEDRYCDDLPCLFPPDSYGQDQIRWCLHTTRYNANYYFVDVYNSITFILLVMYLGSFYDPSEIQVPLGLYYRQNCIPLKIQYKLSSPQNTNTAGVEVLTSSTPECDFIWK